MNYKEIDCYCSVCKRITHHSVLAEETNGWDEGGEYRLDYKIAKCKGCDDITFVLESTNDCGDYYNKETGEIEHFETDIYTYPSKDGDVSPIESEFLYFDVPDEIRNVYLETINAINNNCYLLAAAGFRATIEAICKEKGVNGNNLDKKINALLRGKYISENTRNTLHSVRFLGNDSVHEIKKPKKEALLVVLEIVNNLLNNLYILDHKCERRLATPIKTWDDLLIVINNALQSPDLIIGNDYKLDEILKKSSNKKIRTIAEDNAKYEGWLQEKINDGSFSKFSIVPSQNPAKYKILSK